MKTKVPTRDPKVKVINDCHVDKCNKHYFFFFLINTISSLIFSLPDCSVFLPLSSSTSQPTKCWILQSLSFFFFFKEIYPSLQPYLAPHITTSYLVLNHSLLLQTTGPLHLFPVPEMLPSGFCLLTSVYFSNLKSLIMY